MIQYNIRTLGKNEWDFLELVACGLHMKPVSTERLHQMDKETEMLGLRAFVWNIEKSI
jgi:hypothetical protein